MRQHHPLAMADIFISYERSDRPVAERIAEILQRHGWSAWWDRKILAGEQFSKTIETALRSSRCVIVLWSATSVTSTWVRDEAAAGAERNILVPVVIGEVEIPLGFRQLHAVTLAASAASEGDSTFDDLVSAVAGVMARSEPDAAIKVDQPAIGARGDTRAIGGATVPRSYLYGAFSVIALLVALLLWRQFGADGAQGSSDSTGARTNQSVSGPEAVANGNRALPSNENNQVRGSSSSTGPGPSASDGARGESRGGGEQAESAAAGAEVTITPAESTSIVVTAKDTSFYTLFDETATKRLSYSATDQPVETLPGKYVVELNGIRRNVNLAPRTVTRIAAGTLLLSGTGTDFYSVIDPTSKRQLAYSVINNPVQLFAGEYLLSVHGVEVPAVVRHARVTTFAAGRVVVPGAGGAFYTVLDAKGERQVAYSQTDREVELLPGNYTIEINNIRRSAQIVAGQKTVIDR